MPKRERAKAGEDSKSPAKRKAAATTVKRGVENVIVPRDSDVLFGRGDNINRHPGNIKFRELVERKKKVYLASHFKREKRMIADNIVAAIRNSSPPARFLAKNPKNGRWESVDDNRAREKTSQALREKARVVKAEIDNQIRRQYSSEQQQLETGDSSDQEQPVPNAVTATEESKEPGQPTRYDSGSTSLGIQQSSQGGSVHAATQYPPHHLRYPHPQPSYGGPMPINYPQFPPSSYPMPQGYCQGMPLTSISTGMTHASLPSAQSMQQTNSFQQQQTTFMNRTKRSSCIQSPSLPTDREMLMPNAFSSQVNTTEESKLNNAAPASPTLRPRGSPLETTSTTPLSTSTFEALQRVAFPETSPGALSQDGILVPSLDSPLQPTPLPTERSQASSVHQSLPTPSAQLQMPDPTNTSLLQQSMAATSLSQRNNRPHEFVQQGRRQQQQYHNSASHQQQQQQLNSASHQQQTIPQMNFPQSQRATLDGTVPQANQHLPYYFQQQLEEVQERQRQIQLQLMAQQQQQQNQNQQQWRPHLRPRNVQQQPQESKQEYQILQPQHSSINTDTVYSPIVAVNQNSQQLAIPAANLGSDNNDASVPYYSYPTQDSTRHLQRFQENL